MGILDDAIRDHLDLKRRHGADEPELKKLEDEAFGPPGRPDASGSGGSASAVATPPVQSPSPEITPEDLGLESLPESSKAAAEAAAETPPPDGPAPEEPPAPSPEPGAEPSSEGGTVVFHDFAAEEGLVASGRAPATREASAPIEPTDPVERALAQPTPETPAEEAPEAKPDAGATQAQPAEESPEPAESEEPTGEAPPPEPAVPVSEDTQVHDMAKELDLGSEESSPPGEPSGGGADEPALELDVEDLDIELTDGDASVEQPEGAEEESEDESEDVLEETPEFLRDAPESDRLWFEQGKPKDFDFDDE